MTVPRLAASEISFAPRDYRNLPFAWKHTAEAALESLAARRAGCVVFGTRKGWSSRRETGPAHRLFRPQDRHLDGCHHACGEARLRLGMDLGSLRLGCGHAGGLDPGQHQQHQGWHVDHADAGAHAGDGGHDGHDAGPAFRQPLHRGCRRLRPASGRRLAWRRLRQAGDAAPGVRADNEGRCSRARTR